MSKNNLERYKMVSRDELLATIGISMPTLFKWRGLGMPHYRNDRTIRYNLPEILEWMRANDRPRKSRKGSPNKNRRNRNPNNKVAKRR